MNEDERNNDEGFTEALAIDALRRGLESMRAGNGVPAREFLEEMRKKHNIPEEDV